MNRVEELIQQLCPNGVEWKKLGDYIELYTGEQLNKDAMLSDGVYPVMNGGVLASGFTDSFNEEADTITISQGGASAGFVNWIESKFWAGAHCFIVKVINDKIINRYLYFFLKNSERKMMLSKYGAGIPSLSKESVNKLLIPIPPLSIQQEIVRILDTFTELTANLQTELDARKKQYAYYRDCLLNFEGVDGVEWKKLGEICVIVRGASPRPINKFLTSGSEGVNWIKIGDTKAGVKYITETKEKITKEGASKSRYVKKGDFILSNSMSFGRPYILAVDGCIHDGWLSISAFENVLISDYFYYILNSAKVQQEMKMKASFGGAVQNLNVDIVKSLEIPIPPLPEQRRIVAILDHFETLVNDLSVGLPAELEARRKQYEYYRDKLLTFDRV